MAILYPTALGLTDYEMAAIRCAAKQVPHEHRARFLELFADRMIAGGELSDAQVLDTAAGVLADMIALPD